MKAQEAALWAQAKEIDSLMYYSRFEEGATQSERLLDFLLTKYPEKTYIDLTLQVALFKAGIYARRERRSEAAAIALWVTDQAQQHNLPEKEFRGCLIAAELYEQAGYWELCKTHLNRAYALHKRHKLDNFYSVYCIRVSSYYRFNQQKDSALYFAKEGLQFAEKYANYREQVDAYLLLAILYGQEKREEESSKYALAAAGIFTARRDYDGAAAMYTILTNTYTKNKEYDKAMMYSNSALAASQTSPLQKESSALVWKARSALFEALGKMDSAFLCFQKYHAAHIENMKRQDIAQIKNITERYENDKKETELNSKNQQISFAFALILVIATAGIFLIISNRKIRKQNKIIGAQVEELTHTVEQKQILLSELQHRVKNNLQQVISILEIQKESVGFHSIEELIRSNQNRIHSMALLHKRLNIAESVNEIDLSKYIGELAELLRSSYEGQNKWVEIFVACNIKKISIEKALPIGLIVVELISNSLKHAFNKSQSGKIAISLHESTPMQKRAFHYSDSGKGFDFYKISEKGLGMEIVKGLMEQLDAQFFTDNKGALGGFCLNFRF